MTTQRLLLPVLALAAVLVGCGPIPRTGFEIRVHPPDANVLKAGRDFNTLYVDVVSDGDEQSFTTPVGEGTRLVNGNYVVVVLMEGEKHTKADITVSLKADETPKKSRIEPGLPVVQGELSVFNVDFSTP